MPTFDKGVDCIETIGTTPKSFVVAKSPADMPNCFQLGKLGEDGRKIIKQDLAEYFPDILFHAKFDKKEMQLPFIRDLPHRREDSGGHCWCQGKQAFECQVIPPSWTN